MLFILLCVVFLLAYGVAAQSLLYPNAVARWDILYQIVYHPYFSMYQEFNLDELEGIQLLFSAFILWIALFIFCLFKCSIVLRRNVHSISYSVEYAYAL